MEHPELVKGWRSNRAHKYNFKELFVGIFLGGIAALALTLPAKANDYDSNNECVSVYDEIVVDGEELRQVLYLEAGGECYEGQMMVVEVVFNRVLSDGWPDTVYGVLSQKSQFETWKYRAKARPTKIQDDAISDVLRGSSAIKQVLLGLQQAGQIDKNVCSTDYVFFATKPHKWMHNTFKFHGHWFGTE